MLISCYLSRGAGWRETGEGCVGSTEVLVAGLAARSSSRRETSAGGGLQLSKKWLTNHLLSRIRGACLVGRIRPFGERLSGRHGEAATMTPSGGARSYWSNPAKGLFLA